MKKFVIAALLVLIMVGVVAGLSYRKLYLPMKATVPGGGTWVIEDLSINFWSSDVMPDGTTIIGMERETGRIYKSTDEGSTWNQINQISTKGAICLTFCDSYGNIYVSAEASSGPSGLYRSSDGGQTFQRVWSDPTTDRAYVTHWGMTEDENGVLYIAQTWGPRDIYKSVDQGQTWQKISSIPGAKHLHGLLYNPSNGWFYCVAGDPPASTYPGNGLWRSKNRCLTWDHFTNLDDWDIMSIGFYLDYVFCAIHWREGQVMRLRDNDNLAAPWEEVFRASGDTGYLQNWVQLYQLGSFSAMVTGGERSLSSSYPVGVWASQAPPFNAGSWSNIYLDGALTGYTGTACASHKTSKNGWLFVANNFLGHGIRMRFG